VQDTATDLKLLKPEPPLPQDCCGGGCTLCVWDIYELEKQAFEQQLALKTLLSAPNPP